MVKVLTWYIAASKEPIERLENTSLKTHDMNEGLEKYSFSCVESKKESAPE